MNCATYVAPLTRIAPLLHCSAFQILKTYAIIDNNQDEFCHATSNSFQNSNVQTKDVMSEMHSCTMRVKRKHETNVTFLLYYHTPLVSAPMYYLAIEFFV